MLGIHFLIIMVNITKPNNHFEKHTNISSSQTVKEDYIVDFEARDTL